jgi:hypothetical protein
MMDDEKLIEEIVKGKKDNPPSSRTIESPNLYSDIDNTLGKALNFPKYLDPIKQREL